MHHTPEPNYAHPHYALQEPMTRPIPVQRSRSPETAHRSRNFIGNVVLFGVGAAVATAAIAQTPVFQDTLAKDQPPAASAAPNDRAPLPFQAELSPTEVNDLLNDSPAEFRGKHPEEAAHLEAIGRTVLRAAEDGPDETDPVLRVSGDAAIAQAGGSEFAREIGAQTAVLTNAADDGRYNLLPIGVIGAPAPHDDPETLLTIDAVSKPEQQ